eukprot:COSAG02_NODE_217_length_28595_cov_19.642371_24_plen_150_part_00
MPKRGSKRADRASKGAFRQQLQMSIPHIQIHSCLFLRNGSNPPVDGRRFDARSRLSNALLRHVDGHSRATTQSSVARPPSKLEATTSLQQESSFVNSLYQSVLCGWRVFRRFGPKRHCCDAAGDPTLKTRLFQHPFDTILTSHIVEKFR